MALDEAMLEAAARGESAYLRIYGWSEPTLSLGYFQRIAEVAARTLAGRAARSCGGRRAAGRSGTITS